MRLRISWGKYAVYNLIVTILVYIVISALMGFFSLKLNPFVILYVSAGINLFLYLVYIFPYFGLFVPALILTSGSLYYITKKEKFISMVQGITDTINNSLLWFGDYAYSADKLNTAYSEMIIIAAVIAVTIILFYLVIARKKILFSLAAGVAAFSVLWFMGYSKSFGFMQQYVFVSFLAYGFANYEDMENRWKLRQDKYSRKIPAFLAACIVCATMLVFVLAGFMPGSSGHISYQWFNDNVLDKVVDKWSDVVNMNAFGTDSSNEKFNVSSVGFSEKPSKLGGAVRLSNYNNILLLKVKADNKIKTPIYLRGSVSNYYNGSIWTKQESQVYISEDSIDAANLFGSMSRVRRSTSASLTIYPQSIDTATIFNIWRPVKVDTSGKSYYYDDEGEINLPRPADRHKEYTVEAVIPQIYSEELENAPKVKPGADMRKYFQLPEALPDRVRSLALRITDKYNNNYDKAAAIEQYLRQNYPYTLSPSSVPDGKDFVDYFLFEDKKGYCTYFASAMAVLSRAAGIPSRYVEGFVLDNSNLDSQGYYNVKADKAHAWVELYFEGYGWVRFEPTSSYAAENYARPTNNGAAAVGDKPVEDKEANASVDSNSKSDNVIKAETAVRRSIPPYVYIIILAAGILAVRVMLKLYFKSMRLNKADRLSGKYAAMEYMNIFERKLKQGGIKRETHETPREFGRRVDPILTPHGINIGEIVDYFDSIRFGNIPVDTKTRHKFKHAIEKADSFIKQRKGTMKYLLFKYLL